MVSYRTLILMTIPATFAVVLEPMAEMIDTAILGHVSTTWVGGLAATNAVLGSFAWLFNFLSYGVTAQIAQSIGAGRLQEIGSYIRTALLMALVIGFGVGLPLFFFGDYLLSHVMGATGELFIASRDYYFIRVLGYPFTILSISLIGILRGVQKVRLTMVMVFIMTAVNAVGSYLAVFHFGFGMRGAAVATVLSFLLGDLLAIGWLYQQRASYGLGGRWQIVRKDILDLSHDGLNLAGRTGLLTLSFFILTMCATRLGTEIVAAHQIALQVWMFAAFFIDGLAITAITLGGQLIGREDHSAHQIMSRRLLLLALFVGCSFFLFYWCAAKWVIGCFTNQQEMIDLLMGIWFWLAVTQPLNALAYTYDGLLFSSREFAFLRRRMLEGFVFVFLPLAAWGFLWAQSLLGLWLGLFGLNLYRAASGWWKCRNLPTVF
jgi:MATE family multidrug resistance protein